MLRNLSTAPARCCVAHVVQKLAPRAVVVLSTPPCASVAALTADPCHVSTLGAGRLCSRGGEAVAAAAQGAGPQHMPQPAQAGAVAAGKAQHTRMHTHAHVAGLDTAAVCAGHELSMQLCLRPAMAGMALCCIRHDKHAGFSLQGACPALESLNLSGCPSLEYVLVQSNSLTRVDLSSCGSLSKVWAADCGLGWAA